MPAAERVWRNPLGGLGTVVLRRVDEHNTPMAPADGAAPLTLQCDSHQDYVINLYIAALRLPARKNLVFSKKLTASGSL